MNPQVYGFSQQITRGQFLAKSQKSKITLHFQIMQQKSDVSCWCYLSANVPAKNTANHTVGSWVEVDLTRFFWCAGIKRWSPARTSSFSQRIPSVFQSLFDVFGDFQTKVGGQQEDIDGSCIGCPEISDERFQGNSWRCFRRGGRCSQRHFQCCSQRCFQRNH